MSYNNTLKYRTFEELVADAASDFKKYQLQDLIDPQDLVKVARRCNYELGLRINQVKERVLEVEKGKVKLPNDFYTFNFALGLGKYETKQYLPQGTHMEEKIIGKAAPEFQEAPPKTIDTCTDVVITETPNPCDPCAQCGEQTNCEPCNTCCANPDSCSIDCKGDLVQVVQQLKYQTKQWTETFPIRLVSSTEKFADWCPNREWDSIHSMEIKDGWIYTSFQSGNLYLNFQGQLENEDGELLVPDHELLNEYYEYALKQRILENLIMNDEEINPNKIQLIEGRYRNARNNAMSLVNTPNYTEMKELYQANRNAQYSKYYDMFASYGRRNIR
jgi:hypothetical protein